ncbi:hypothetical protein L2E82_13245 [Cichorium intybus]|uniref:Uncharacterized protein n=1 Tax=Cichorium intybus TaxID=13427 RepID=A0ACB9GJC1_CICIN|nr:hypothetical protein L2E82_13245 [Cichorium intybus]
MKSNFIPVAILGSLRSYDLMAEMKFFGIVPVKEKSKAKLNREGEASMGSNANLSFLSLGSLLPLKKNSISPLFHITGNQPPDDASGGRPLLDSSEEHGYSCREVGFEESDLNLDNDKKMWKYPE